jgi:hypothetical protein
LLSKKKRRRLLLFSELQVTLSSEQRPGFVSTFKQKTFVTGKRNVLFRVFRFSSAKHQENHAAKSSGNIGSGYADVCALCTE